MNSSRGTEQKPGNQAATYQLPWFPTASDVPGILKMEQPHLNDGGASAGLAIGKKNWSVSHITLNEKMR